MDKHSKKMAENFVLKEISDFGKETTIHGINHVFSDITSTLKRLLWLFVLIFLFIYAGLLLHSSIVSKYQNTSVGRHLSVITI